VAPTCVDTPSGSHGDLRLQLETSREEREDFGMYQSIERTRRVRLVHDRRRRLTIEPIARETSSDRAVQYFTLKLRVAGSIRVRSVV